jgi:hypothetical protein
MTGSGQLWRKVAWTAVPPLVVLGVAILVLAWSGRVGEQWRFTLQWAPVAVAAAGLGVALHFNRSRAFFATLTLVAAWFALLHAGEAGGFAEAAVFAAACVFVPLNLMIFSMIHERGVFTRAGTFRFLLIFLQAVFVAIVVWSESAKLVWLLTAPIFESGLTRALAVAPPGLLMMLVALLAGCGYNKLQGLDEQVKGAWGEVQNQYQRRAGVEGTISQGVRTTGSRRTRYRGLAKTHLQHVAKASAINLARLAAWFEGVPQAKTPTSRFAALRA